MQMTKEHILRMIDKAADYLKENHYNYSGDREPPLGTWSDGYLCALRDVKKAIEANRYE